MRQDGRTLILGLGNPILGDDGVGIAIAREIKDRWPGDPSTDIIEASLAGRFLLKLIYECEERFPHFLGKYGQYPLIELVNDK